MVNEREPPRQSAAQQQPRSFGDRPSNPPEFAKPSPLRYPAADKNAHVFNVPKQGQPRPEHHRPKPVPESGFINPLRARPQPAREPDVVEIPKPTNFPTCSTRPAPNQGFSSLPSAGGFQSINNFYHPPPRQVVDLTRRDDEFDPDKALTENDRFGAPDPFAYVDPAQATDNIKALLEGAFDEEDDKPRTRRRRKQLEQKAADSLAHKLGGLKVDDGEDSATAEEAEDEDEEEDDAKVEGLKVRLLPHQIDGLAWMADKEIGQRKKNGVLPKGGILADDMGLGKTIQAIGLILSNPRPAEDAKPKHAKAIPSTVGKGTLVVAPLALIKQWESELESKVERSHKLRVLVHHGPSRTKRAAELNKYDVIITTYQILASEHAASSDKDDGIKVGCIGVHWYRIIVDEAHTIKNRNAKMTKACYALKSHYRWCLTGTPMQNNLDELQSLIAFLRIKPFNQLGYWKDQITGPMKNGRGGLAMKRLQYFLKACMKRRTKDVLKQDGALKTGASQTNGKESTGDFKIVGRRVKSIVAEFDPDEQRFYDEIADKAKGRLDEMMGGAKTDYVGALVLLLRLRQICNHSELVRGKLKRDDAILASGISAESNAHLKNNQTADDMAGLNFMMEGLSVARKKCELCQHNLSSTLAEADARYCSDCEAGLNSQRQKHDKRAKKVKHKKAAAANADSSDIAKLRAARNRRLITDSDDEDDRDWIVPKDNQHKSSLGVAGDTDDENAEGGGEWLHSDDNDTDDGPQHDGTQNGSQSLELQEGSDSEEESHSEEEGLIESTKIRYLVRILQQECPRHKVIVFSQFTSMLDLIEPFLDHNGFTFARYDGSMRNDHREESLNRLRNDEDTRVLLCSLKCGSLGLNLTAASRVVILEPFWNPFVEEQAIDRVHRLNQTVDVVVYKITIANTVEERILDLQEAKRKLADAAIEGGKAINKLSMADILKLFNRDAEHEHHADPKDAAIGAATRVLNQPSRTKESSPVRQPAVSGYANQPLSFGAANVGASHYFTGLPPGVKGSSLLHQQANPGYADLPPSLGADAVGVPHYYNSQPTQSHYHVPRDSGKARSSGSSGGKRDSGRPRQEDAVYGRR